jgi:4-diphosphocytidyl-2-C-methyl-D-erythritol kinase
VNIKVKTNAKINLGLNIVGKKENGYHLLDMIMVPISLCDTLEITIKDKKGELTIKSNLKDIPTGRENIIYKIYELFYKETGLEEKEVEVYLEKVIPSQAGLGGGSSNGAFFFNELNKYYNNPISLERALEITKDIGADIPFFLVNKPCRVQGIGEKLEILENNLKEKLILIKPDFGVSTIVAYKNYSKLENKKDANIPNVIEGMKTSDLELIENSIENHLEQGLLLDDKNIIEFRKKLREIKGQKFFMSGSGSCYYTFVKEDNIKSIQEKIRATIGDCRIEVCDFL